MQDEKIIQMWDDAKNEYAVLSTYVTDIEKLGEDGNGKPHHQVPHLCMVKFTSNVRTHATKCANDLSKPKLTNAVWGAGLSFSKCHAELKVQVDPHTPHIFDGEEFNRAARFWTYGYDIYTPNHVYVLHDYHGSQNNPVTRGWGRNPTLHGTFQDSNKRLRTMLDMPAGESDPAVATRMKRSKFGLGDRRTLDQLIQFSGIDLHNERPSIDGENRCGNIQWIPFTEHPKGVNYIPKFDPDTEDPIDVLYESTSIWYNKEIDVKPVAENHVNLSKNDTASREEEEEETDVIAREGAKQNMVKHLNGVLQSIEKEDKEMNEGVHPADQDLSKMHQSLAVKIGALRGVGKKAKEKVQAVKGFMNEHPLHAKEKVQAIKGFIKEHPLITPEQVHGFSELPVFVQCNVFIMLSGLVFFIYRSKGTGRAFKRNNSRKAA